jgi:hypothetical protein
MSEGQKLLHEIRTKHAYNSKGVAYITVYRFWLMEDLDLVY